MTFMGFDGLKYLEIPSRILELSDEDAENLSFIDNKEREGYNPIDEARHYRHMQDKYGYSTTKLAEKYGGHHPQYVWKLALLDLPNEVVTRVTSNKISEGHCRHIMWVKTMRLNWLIYYFIFMASVISIVAILRHLSQS